MSVRIGILIKEFDLVYLDDDAHYYDGWNDGVRIDWDVSRPSVDTLIKKVAPITVGGNFDLTFCDWKQGLHATKYISESKSQIIITTVPVAQELAHNFTDKFLLGAENPKLIFMEILSQHFLPSKPTGISEHSSIEEGFVHGKSVFIDDFVKIGKNVTIGNNVRISSGVFIVENTVIGDNVTIFSNTVIGADGFGYQFREDGTPVKFQHVGSVVIGNGVEIGANTCVDRGALGDTIIRDNVKIDNLCHIAHNVEIGENTFIIALSMIAGSVKLGKNVWVSPSASVLNQKTVGDRAYIGMGAVVLKDVKDNTTVVGNPARVLEGRGGSNINKTGQTVKTNS